MRASSLFVVLALAKLLTLVGHQVPVSPWAPIAYFWQDALVAVLFALTTTWLRRPAIARVLYVAIACYTAINVPIARMLSSPLTPSMLRAAGGPLSDSIRSALTAANLAAIGAVAAAALLVPRFLERRPRPRVDRAAAIVGLLMIVTGPFAASRVETVGVDRTAVLALWPMTSLPARAAAAVDARISPFEPSRRADLSSLRGTAKGFNVIVVILESTAAQYLGLYGAPEDPMPNLSALGRRAVVFDAAYAVYPESIKGLFATLCSREPAYDAPAEVAARAPCVSLADRLRDAGYRTALFHSGRFRYLGMQAVVDHRGFERLEDAGDIGGLVQSSFGVDEPSTVRRLLSWIDSLEPGESFFASYLPVAGHHPYATNRAGPFADTTDFGRYRNALHEGDAALGRLLEGLRDRHLEDRTVVVVFGDHGEAFGQHDANFGHTFFIYDENVHVPYLIAVPGASPRRDGRVASLIDTAPTILDLLGLPAEPGHHGASLLLPGARMALFFTDYALGWLGLRDGSWKFLYEINDGRSKLFDVCADPGERRDRAPEFARRSRVYRERLEEWIAATRNVQSSSTRSSR